jgi:hypothetical protein
MHPGDVEIEAHWQTLDVVPPHAEVAPLPAYLRTNAEVSWQGIDAGGAGIRFFDVQYRVNDDAWTDWLTNNVGNVWFFDSQPGNTVHFRARAIDNAYNVEPWSGNGNTATTFYDWAISGSASDNRSTPIHGVSATGAKAFEIWPSDDAGAYRSYYAGSNYLFSSTWDKSGYLALPATSFSRGRDIKRNVVLPPSDNVVQDWGFESQQLPSASWSAGGAYTPAITTTRQHTGHAAAFLGLPFALEPPTTLNSGQLAAEQQQLFMDESGALHAFWVGEDTPFRRIYYDERSAAGVWSGPEAITSADDDLREQNWGVSSTGRVHVVWQTHTGDHDELYHRSRNESGTWSPPQMVYSADEATPLHLAIDEEGDAHLVWSVTKTSGEEYYYAHTTQGGNLSSPSLIGAPAPNGWYILEDLAVGSNGKVHLIWRYGSGVILYSSRLADGSWSAGEMVFSGSNYWYVASAVNAYGQVHVISYHSATGRSYHRVRTPGGAWSSARLLDEAGPGKVEILAAADGSTHMVWSAREAGSSCSDLKYATIDRFGMWTGPVLVSVGERCVGKVWLNMDEGVPFAVSSSWRDVLCLIGLGPDVWGPTQCVGPMIAYGQYDVVADSLNQVYVLGAGDFYHLWFSETARATTDGASTISQEVVVPAAATNPTLSFLYGLDGGGAGGGYLEVAATVGVTTTTLYSTTTATAGWTHQWVDMSSWAGQAITLSVAVEQVAGEINTSALVDEVTLGAAYPDTWVAIKAPSGIAPGGTMTLTIAYGNRSGVAAAGGEVTLALPPELSFISADPAPITTTPVPTWDVGALAAGSEGAITVRVQMASDAVVGDLLSLVATLTSTSDELELFNNTFEGAVRVGDLTYLPTIKVK